MDEILKGDFSFIYTVGNCWRIISSMKCGTLRKYIIVVDIKQHCVEPPGPAAFEKKLKCTLYGKKSASCLLHPSFLFLLKTGPQFFFMVWNKKKFPSMCCSERPMIKFWPIWIKQKLCITSGKSPLRVPQKVNNRLRNQTLLSKSKSPCLPNSKLSS